ncbi:sugar phosphate isomerase [Salipaludibacillus neizhouensis]|uniref:Sugar phosphate isomerase n=1 Tax=Salipaludibacillus neizhouensis TaxID=885475 RepID=A0A3A9KBD1_9BACI|nr:sugar phosphate isomerase/epimerase [Salipaludibacillus neizhouensis]RKL66883.1 sugar phosphate isomerase [Salipaludibacillus neizhouensis]
MSVGVLAHLFGKLPYKELATNIGEYGFDHVQLALWKGIDDYDFSKPGLLTPNFAQKIGDAFNKNGVSISVLACYLHLFERDEKVRRENLERFKELIRHAKFMGAPMVAAEVGKPDGKVEASDWKTLVQSIEELTEEAEKWGVYLGIEAANGHLIGTAPELKQLLDEVPSSNIGVVLDPGNLMDEQNFNHQDQVIEEAFSLLGNRIIAAHAKDRKWNGKTLDVLPAGQGTMNYEKYLQLLEQYKPFAPIIMEECKKEELLDSKTFIENIQYKLRN